MRKITAFMVVALITLVFAAAAAAHPGWPARHRHLRGEIVSLDASATTPTVTFLRLNDTTMTLQVVATTRILKNGHWATFDRLALGDRGKAKYVRTETGELRAIKLIVRTPIMRGKITEITSDTVTLFKPGLKITRVFNVDADTKIKRNGADAALTDLKIRDQAKIYYNKLESGELIAKRIKAAGE